jgi:uroporphyrinogen decarboxylase
MTEAADTMSSLERVLTTLGHKEPDRVPLFLLLAMQGARELGLSIRDYFGTPAHVAEGQRRLRARYGHDCLYSFHYASIETAAWGGDVIFRDDGPPNAGAPLVHRLEDIAGLKSPRIEDAPGLCGVLEATRLLAAEAQGEVPVIGVVMSPFSLPVMQLGFEAYLVLMHEHPELFQQLMRLNEAFCVAWGNAQVEAGATAICYFDPISSSTMVPPSMFRETGLPIAQRTLARIKAPAALHFASARCMPIVDDLPETGAVVAGVSADEDLHELKRRCGGRIGLLGNLNGIAMRRWTPEEAEAEVKAAIAAAGPGGGFILADNHGEIPWQVPDAVLTAVAEASRRWGRYPLDWCRLD